MSKTLWDMFKDLSTSPEEPTAKAKELCSSFLGEQWKNLTSDNFELSIVSGGMTNQMFKCKQKELAAAGIEPSTVLLRIQCEKDEMQKQNEIAMFIELAHAGLGPHLLGIFPGGRLEQFIPSRSLTHEETASPRNANQVASLMAKVHRLNVPLAKKPQIISTMRSWLDKIIRNGGETWQLYSKYVDIPTDKYPAVISVDDIRGEIDRIEQFLENSKSPIFFTHSDLFAGNILLKDGFSIDENGIMRKEIDGKSVETEEDALVLIDFEFGMYNYRGFDIGNFMNELGIWYNDEESYWIHLEILTNKELHADYCRSYLNETYKTLTTQEQLEKANLSGQLEIDIATLLAEIHEFQAIANLWWGIYIMTVQEGIIGLDFESAFRDRFALYFYLKSF